MNAQIVSDLRNHDKVEGTAGHFVRKSSLDKSHMSPVDALPEARLDANLSHTTVRNPHARLAKRSSCGVMAGAQPFFRSNASADLGDVLMRGFQRSAWRTAGSEDRSGTRSFNRVFSGKASYYSYQTGKTATRHGCAYMSALLRHNKVRGLRYMCGNRRAFATDIKLDQFDRWFFVRCRTEPRADVSRGNRLRPSRGFSFLSASEIGPRGFPFATSCGKNVVARERFRQQSCVRAGWSPCAHFSWPSPCRCGPVKAFHAAWADQLDAASLLAAVAADGNAPAFARASVLTDLAPSLSLTNANLARAGLSDPDPMVRLGALEMLEGVPANQIWQIASPLLFDPSRGVRIKAASLLAAVPTANQPAADREQFERAAAEFIAAQRLNADRPESRSALGSFLAKRGQVGDAETEYKAALHLNPQYSPAAINLADLYRNLGRDGDSESVLRAAITAAPQDAGLHYSLGLALVRLKRSNEALEELRKATELDSGQARYAYVYAVALHSAGRGNEAIVALKENLVRHPNDRDTLSALISFGRESGDIRSALEYAERLARLEESATVGNAS
jgi:Flp pilus assembly protein TadD